MFAVGIGVTNNAFFTGELDTISDGTNGENVVQVEDFDAFLNSIDNIVENLQTVTTIKSCISIIILPRIEVSISII